MNPITRFWNLCFGSVPQISPQQAASAIPISASEPRRTGVHAGPEHSQSAPAAARRSGIVLIAVGIFSSVGVYLGHDWFHGKFLPSLGIGAALGDAVGGFVIILAAYAAQRLASLALFDDSHFGLLRSDQQLRQANADLMEELSEADMRASVDRLTGCWNRRGFEELIRGEVERLARHGTPVSMLIVDIDYFKSINDRFGHNVGDRVLAEVANQLRISLRLSDSLTRWGGEEFIVLCPNTPLTTAVILAERLLARIGQTHIDPVGPFTVSFGVAECLIDEDWPNWLGRADAALYRAKRNGRNQVQFAPETSQRATADDPRGFRLVQLSWRKALECGNEEIDRDHEALFSIANDLLNASVSGWNAKDIEEVVDRLVRETTEHFAREEAVLSAAGYPKVAAHAEIHRRLAHKAARLLGEFKTGLIEIGPLLEFLSRDLIAGHVLGADREFFPYLRGPTTQTPTERTGAAV